MCGDDSFQEKVRNFVRSHQLEADVRDRTLDLASELGEVAKEVLKGTAYGRRPFTPGAGWVAELGDVFFSLVCLAQASGVDLTEALDVALAKYEERVRSSGRADSAR